MDRQSFEDQLRPLLKAAYGFARKLTRNPEEAEDLLQDATLAAYKGREGFHPGTNFKAWYFRILMNAHYRNGRRKQVDSVLVDDVPEAFIYQQARANGTVPEGDPATTLLGRVDEALITRALEDLPEDYREVCLLYFLGEMSYEDIAFALKVPGGTVRSRLHRGRKILQKSLWTLAHERGLVSEAGGN